MNSFVENIRRYLCCGSVPLMMAVPRTSIQRRRCGPAAQQSTVSTHLPPYGKPHCHAVQQLWMELSGTRCSIRYRLVRLVEQQGHLGSRKPPLLFSFTVGSVNGTLRR